MLVIGTYPQADALADDVNFSADFDKLSLMTEEEVTAYFESGGVLPVSARPGPVGIAPLPTRSRS